MQDTISGHYFPTCSLSVFTMLSSADAKDLLSYVTKDDPIKMLCHLPCHFMTSEKWTRGKRTTTTTQLHNSHRFRKFNPGFVLLNLSIQSISESCIEIKIFIFTLLCGASKCFMKAFKAFKALKAFEAAQRKVKIKIYLNFFHLYGIGAGRVNVKNWFNSIHESQSSSRSTS